ncbi:MAG: AmmeMemoRadiSam system protein B [Ignavibacteriales bacterium]|nr:AmmeMemoRadiSam system protein B [Ignavibacteriales bacterium]
MSKNVRLPAVAGTFYPADPSILTQDLNSLIDDAEKTAVHGKIVSLIVPHAGYIYSGLTAAHAYKLIEGIKFQTVVVISPSHREYFGGISIFDGTHYRTPLGDIQIDTHLRELLVTGDKIIESSLRGHGGEHAIEIQLPFLQLVQKDFKLLPIVIGDQSADNCYHLGKRLGEILKDKNVLIIASTDLSHFHESKSARKLDQIAIDKVSKFDYEGLMYDLEFEKTEACGGGPMVATLMASKFLGADSVKILHHCNSGDITGEHDSVVGYFSAVILKS